MTTKIIGIVLSVCIGVAAFEFYYHRVVADRDAARRTLSANNLRQLGIALIRYQGAHGAFPARAIFDKAGRPLLSWRVAILPYLDQKSLYDQFHLDEPWDSPHNKPLVARIPDEYRSPFRAVDGKTNYLAPVGPGLVFDGRHARPLYEITDGADETVLILEANDDRAVEWTRPDDLTIDLKKPSSDLGQFRPEGFYALFCDGAIFNLPNDIDPKSLLALLTVAGGEKVSRDDLLPPRR